MEYTTLGTSGLSVSRICLGTMNFGWERDGWKLDADESRAIIERAIELGINFIDTANVYRGGESEAVIGDVIADYDRDEIVLATKVYGDMNSTNPNAQGLSRKAIEQELSNSLERLGIDTIDLYQIHRWDENTPIEETLRTLDDAVRRNDVRYIGASSMWAHQFADALHTSDTHGLERFVSMQNHYNAVYRFEELEMLPLCEKEGIGVIPWSPLARGYLTRPHDEFDSTQRGKLEAGERDNRHQAYRNRGGQAINAQIEALAEKYDVTMAQIAIAWHLHTDPVTAPIIGVSSIDHLEEAVEAVDLTLSDEDVAAINSPYEPVTVEGHS